MLMSFWSEKLEVSWLPNKIMSPSLGGSTSLLQADEIKHLWLDLLLHHIRKKLHLHSHVAHKI